LKRTDDQGFEEHGVLEEDGLGMNAGDSGDVSRVVGPRRSHPELDVVPETIEVT
jgi:hypothetical protein